MDLDMCTSLFVPFPCSCSFKKIHTYLVSTYGTVCRILMGFMKCNTNTKHTLKFSGKQDEWKSSKPILRTKCKIALLGPHDE